MSGGGEGLSAPKRVRRGKSSNRKKSKRIGFKLDMTPLVDISFLLLTFFMFTTTMLKPQIMEMKLPPEMGDVEVRETELFTLYLTGDNKIYWLYMSAKDDNKPEEIQIQNLKAKAVEMNLKPITKNKLITAFKIDQNAKYENVIKILDELNIAELPITDEVVKDKNPDGTPVKRTRKFTVAPFEEKDKKLIEELK
jgi:biopolymer transport protein ExbD